MRRGHMLSVANGRIELAVLLNADAPKLTRTRAVSSDALATNCVYKRITMTINRFSRLQLRLIRRNDHNDQRASVLQRKTLCGVTQPSTQHLALQGFSTKTTMSFKRNMFKTCLGVHDVPLFSCRSTSFHK